MKQRLRDSEASKPSNQKSRNPTTNRELATRPRRGSHDQPLSCPSRLRLHAKALKRTGDKSRFHSLPPTREIPNERNYARVGSIIAGRLTMNIALDFDKKNNILRGTLEGPMTGAILLELYAAALEYMASHLPCRAILDFSRVTDFEVSGDAIRRIAAAPPAVPSGYMRVLVVPQIFIYGLARMFQILGEKTRPELQVVRTLDEAYRLLGVESPEFYPVN
jgi:hypothetical protein